LPLLLEHHGSGIKLQGGQSFAELFVCLIHARQFKIIEPKAAAALATHVHDQCFELQGGERCCTRRTFHKAVRLGGGVFFVN
jgi:hypothetical protein